MKLGQVKSRFLELFQSTWHSQVSKFLKLTREIIEANLDISCETKSHTNNMFVSMHACVSACHTHVCA